MNNEDIIPEYAMLPAKEAVDDLEIKEEPIDITEQVINIEPSVVGEIKESNVEEVVEVMASEEEENNEILLNVNADYSTLKFTSVDIPKKHMIEIDEDILVPDTKPDMKEILAIDGTVVIKNNSVGEMKLKTIYVPEKKYESEIVSIESNLQFKTKLTDIDDDVNIFGKIEHLEYTIINERKFRIKCDIILMIEAFIDKEIEMFEGIKDEDLEMLTEKIEFSKVALRKKDILSVDEILPLKDDSVIPKEILKTDVKIMENYKQITGEKVVVNGFIVCSMLYLANADEDKEKCQLESYQAKSEFTQFIPINQSGSWSGLKVDFVPIDLKVAIDDTDENRGFKLYGDVKTQIQLYQDIVKDVVVDGYSKEGDLVFEKNVHLFNKISSAGFYGFTQRQVMAVPENIKSLKEVIYTSGNILNCDMIKEEDR